MLIGEFCRATGLGRDTVRFYVRRGLLTPGRGSRPGNDYQVFGPGQVERARLIRAAQSLGFTLKEIAALAAAYEREDMTREEKIALRRDRVVRLDAHARQLPAMRGYLIEKVDGARRGRPGRSRHCDSPAAPLVRPHAPEGGDGGTSASAWLMAVSTIATATARSCGQAL